MFVRKRLEPCDEETCEKYVYQEYINESQNGVRDDKIRRINEGREQER